MTEVADMMADLNTSAFVAKRLGIRLTTALEIPTDAVMAISRYINEHRMNRLERHVAHDVEIQLMQCKDETPPLRWSTLFCFDCDEEILAFDEEPAA